MSGPRAASRWNKALARYGARWALGLLLTLLAVLTVAIIRQWLSEPA